MKPFAFITALLFHGSLLRAQYFDLREGNAKYLAGDYDEAKRRYDKIIAEEETLEKKKEAIFNSGNALYRMKKLDEAESDYRKIAENATLDPTLRADAYYNIGNGYFARAKDAQGESKEALLKDAIKHYKESLKLNPNDLQAKQNLEYAKALLKQEEEKKQNNQDKQNQNDKNKNDKDDKQNDKRNQDQKNDKNQNKDDKQNQSQQNQNNQDNQQKPKDQKQDQEQGKQGGAQISQADAEKLLDALKQDEKQMLKKYLMKKSNQAKYDKDW